MPTKRAAPCCVVIDDKLIAVGGISITQEPTDAVEVFDTAKGSWSVKETLNNKLQGATAVVRGMEAPSRDVCNASDVILVCDPQDVIVTKVVTI